MRLRRTAVMVTATVVAIIIVVIAGMTFMGLFGREVPPGTTPRPTPRPVSRRPSSATNGTADRRPSSIRTIPRTWMGSGAASQSTRTVTR